MHRLRTLLQLRPLMLLPQTQQLLLLTRQLLTLLLLPRTLLQLPQRSSRPAWAKARAALTR